MSKICLLPLFAFFISALPLKAQDSFEIRIFNSAEYSIGVGSCDRKCSEYVMVQSNQQATLSIPKTHRELCISRDEIQADPVGYRINDKFIKMSPSLILVFFQHHDLMQLPLKDARNIDLKNKKATQELNLGWLKVLD